MTANDTDVECQTCRGSGVLGATGSGLDGYQRCDDCNGTGRTPESVEFDMRHCGHEWCDCGCYGRPHCKIGCGMDRPSTPENVECPGCGGDDAYDGDYDSYGRTDEPCPVCSTPENVATPGGQQ